MRLKIPKALLYELPKEVHEHPCERCPSAHPVQDEEAQQYIDQCKSGMMHPLDVIFSCAWRPEKLCKGIADRVGYFYIGVDNG